MGAEQPVSLQLFEGNMHYDTPDIRRFDPVPAQYVRVYPERWSPAGIGMRLEVLGCDWTGKGDLLSVSFSFDLGILGGGERQSAFGKQTSLCTCYILGTTSELGEISRGKQFVLDQGSLQFFNGSLSKTNHNHPPPTQIQLDPSSSGQGAVAVDLGKKNPLMIIK